MKHPEDNECKWLWQWASTQRVVKDHLFHVPNGGNRNPREAARLKRQGVRPGVSDYMLPVARGAYHGLWIEMKPPAPASFSVSKAQRDWIKQMLDQGYYASISVGWVAASRLIEEYMQLGEGEKIG